MAGTLIILITSLFMNAGAHMSISDDDHSPNKIVMNTVISAASSGFLVALMNQWTTLFLDKASISER